MRGSKLIFPLLAVAVLVLSIVALVAYFPKRPIYTASFEDGPFDWRVRVDYEWIRLANGSFEFKGGEMYEVDAIGDRLRTSRGFLVRADDGSEEIYPNPIRVEAKRNLTFSQVPVKTIYGAALDELAENNMSVLEVGKLKGRLALTRISLGLDELIQVANDKGIETVFHYKGAAEGIESGWRWEKFDWFYFLDGKTVYYARLDIGASDYALEEEVG